LFESRADAERAPSSDVGDVITCTQTFTLIETLHGAATTGGTVLQHLASHLVAKGHITSCFNHEPKKFPWVKWPLWDTQVKHKFMAGKTALSLFLKTLGEPRLVLFISMTERRECVGACSTLADVIGGSSFAKTFAVYKVLQKSYLELTTMLLQLQHHM